MHLEFAIATGDLPLRKSETKLPGYQTFLSKYPAEKVFVANLDNVKHVRPNIASLRRGVDRRRPDGAVGAARPGRSRRQALKSGSEARWQRRWPVRELTDGGAPSRAGRAGRARSCRGRSRRRRQPGSADGARGADRLGDGRARAVLLIGLFGLVPVVWSFVLSFQHNDLQTPAHVGRAGQLPSS